MSARPVDISQSFAPGLPAAAPKYTGFPKYNFVGGHNDPEHVPVEAETHAGPRDGMTVRTNHKAGRRSTTHRQAADPVAHSSRLYSRSRAKTVNPSRW